MKDYGNKDITLLLEAWSDGDGEALAELMRWSMTSFTGWQSVI